MNRFSNYVLNKEILTNVYEIHTKYHFDFSSFQGP